jgi:hypothetical protein
MIPSQVVAQVESASWFDTAWAPWALLGADLRIEAVNGAFARVAGMPADRLVGRVATAVLDVNSDEPGADATATLVSSVGQVLDTGRPRWLGLHRHDLPDPARPGTFVQRVWMPVHLPVTHRGEVVGVLHHVQDLTPIVRTPSGRGRGTHTATSVELALAQDGLAREFPEVTPENVIGVLTDSLRVVGRVLGAPDPARATELARLRLEVLTGHPARRV